MCGRVFVKQTVAAARLLSGLGLGERELPSLCNLAPTEAVPVLYHTGSGYDLAPMRWWLHPAWSPEPPNQQYAMFNARIETVLTSRAFHGPVKYRRGIVPACGFVEWKKEPAGKQPYYVEAEEGILRLAAIWECWQDQLWSCAIITQPADAHFAPIHNRMPLSLTEDEMRRWLNPAEDAKELVTTFAGATQALKATKVSRSINNARNKVWAEAVE